MKNWIELCSDVNWQDYHGMWAKKAKDGSWYVIRWTNLYDAMGEGDCKRDGIDQYECEVKRIDLEEVPNKEKESALRCCGFKFLRDDIKIIVNEHDGSIIVEPYEKHYEAVLIECMIQYGLGAPLESFTSSMRPINLRAKARKYAEECMKDSEKLENRLDRQVNAIGSTAREYGVGDIRAALFRDTSWDDSMKAKRIVRKMMGI